MYKIIHSLYHLQPTYVRWNLLNEISVQNWVPANFLHHIYISFQLYPINIYLRFNIYWNKRMLGDINSEIRTFLNIEYSEAWRDGSVVRSAGCSWVWFPAPAQQLPTTTICNSRSRKPNVLFQLLPAPGRQVVNARHMCRQNTHLKHTGYPTDTHTNGLGQRKSRSWYWMLTIFPTVDSNMWRESTGPSKTVNLWPHAR